MPSSPKKVIIVGATSAIAEHCARLWIQQSPIELVLVGRNMERLEQIAADLRVRGGEGVKVQCLAADFNSPESIHQLGRKLWDERPVSTALIAHGSLPDQAAAQHNLSACKEALEINAMSPVLFAEGFAQHFEQAGQGTLAIIGSVAGDRGRKSNYIYGAAKGLVERYTQGLQHRLAGTGVKVVLIKPGPTDTPMTAHMKTDGAKLASVESVAERIVTGMAAGKPVVYAPARWALIMLIIKLLPAPIFNRLDI